MYMYYGIISTTLYINNTMTWKDTYFDIFKEEDKMKVDHHNLIYFENSVSNFKTQTHTI